jgi:hypothetical protein
LAVCTNVERAMARSATTTTDHDVIRQWIEERGGYPAAVEGTGDEDDPGILRVAYPGVGDDDDLDEIAWEDFFAKFEEAKLAFLYEDEPENRFSKFVRRKGD